VAEFPSNLKRKETVNNTEHK